MRVLITGGHLTTAVAVIEELQATRPSWEILFVGRTRMIEGSDVPSEEQRIVEAMGIRFLPINAGRLTRSVGIRTVLSIVKFPFGVFQAIAILRSARPDVVLSFGGYVALPLVIAGSLLGITSVTHEQTRVAGLANRIIARLSRQVFVSFPDMVRAFPRGKAIYTGLPVRRIVFHPPGAPQFSLPKTSDPLLFITGGITGSHSINRIVFPALSALLSRHVVVHQVGRYSLNEATEQRQSLPAALRKRYIVAPYLDAESYAWVLSHARLVIGRSGANTVMELALLGAEAILIPLPWSSGGEQQANARWLAEKGLATVVAQSTLTGHTLVRLVENITSVTQKRRPVPGLKKDAARRIVGAVSDL
jgi:UDP-N-acetylglucosamine--N-acetylmuramyl-(pentapeptide) pyrophosphoryl-undecaprenol N-acetylglucosamine transferase